MKLWRSRWPRLKQLTTLISILKEENRLPHCLGLKLNTSLVNVKGSLYIRYAVFSLNFSSAGKGLFMVGKEKNMPQRSSFLGGGEEREQKSAPRRRSRQRQWLNKQYNYEQDRSTRHAGRPADLGWTLYKVDCVYFSGMAGAIFLESVSWKRQLVQLVTKLIL